MNTRPRVVTDGVVICKYNPRLFLCRPQLVLTVIDGLDVRIPHNISRFLSEQRHAHFLECHYREARNFLQVRILVKVKELLL